MLLNKVFQKQFSLRRQVGVFVFVILFVGSTVGLIIFYEIVINRAFDLTSLNTLEKNQINENIISNIKQTVSINFWDIFISITIVNFILDIIISYVSAWWIANPIEKLQVSLRLAHRQGTPYISNRTEKSLEAKEISTIVTEMTEKYVNALEEQNKFVQDISHEFRTPLAAIKSAIDIIKYTPTPSNEDLRYFFETVQIVNEKMVRLVNQLTISNKTDDELYDNTEINFSKIIKDLIQLYLPHAVEKGIKIEINVQQGIKIKGDAKNLSIALGNILDNAIKYSDKTNSTVKIGLKRFKRKVILNVQDMGIGISEMDIRNIFQRFYRGQNSGNIEGTGLGLQITKKIIRAHGGRISIRSKLNTGSDVKIIL